MDIVKAAMRRPISVAVILLGIALAGVAAISRIPRDIFPNLDVPAIFVAQPYAGMDAAQMEGYLTSRYEIGFLYVSGIEHIESKSVQGMSIIKLQFHPGTDMANAMAETINQIQRAQRFMPRGSVPPFVIRFDAGSLPVGSLVISSPTRTEAEMQDLAASRIRPLLASIPGLSAPPPFGGSDRAIVIHVDPDRLRAHNMSSEEIVEALANSNIMSPSGNARIGKIMPAVSLNSVVRDVKELEKVAIRPGRSPAVFLRDIATVEDSASVETGYALIDGRRTVYIPVAKRAEASTLAVVNLLKQNLPRLQLLLPPDVAVNYQFDQSYIVTRSIQNLTMEGLLGAVLTGLMALLFLRDWRSALVVVLTIPISLLAALIGLWGSHQTINLMTLGGLALSVGILVDMATVVIENIHTHRAKGRSIARAALDATKETMIPSLLAMLCILAVFIPSFFMTGAIRAMFIPLSLAVGFALVAAYFLSVTFVPILTTRLLRARPAHGHAEHPPRFSFAAFQARYGIFIRYLLRFRLFLVPAYLAAAGILIVGLGGLLGTEIFPASDEGQFVLRFRAPPGTRIEETEKMALRVIELVKEEAGQGNLESTLGYVGAQTPDHPLNAIYLWTSGPDEAVLQGQLRRGSGIRIEEFKERLRKMLAAKLPEIDLSFEPSDIVSLILAFGAPTPVEIAVSGPDLAANREVAEKLRARLAKIRSLRDVHIEQELDYPTVKVDVDREKTGLLGLTVKNVSDSFVPATSSSKYVEKNFWADPKTGLTYQVEVEVPEERVDSVEEVKNIPVVHNGKKPLLLRSIAEVRQGTAVGQYDRYNLQRTVTLGANISGQDLGRVTREVRQALEESGKPPRGVFVSLRGQVATMEDMFGGLRSGLLITVVAIFLLLAANFQSWKVSLVVVSTVPAVLAGVVFTLYATKTTLNIQSFMGGIMSVGIAVANAILLVSFAERYRREGMAADQAAVEGARSRLRPILMTSLAMIAGMVPMALGLSEGGEQAAPLGRAVVGGLAGSTVATLLILPGVFAMVQGRASLATASMDPDDQGSSYFAPAEEPKP